jgi:hypothetical protein
MAIPALNFQPESFQQANPFLSGVQAGQDIYKNFVQNQYMPQTLQEQLQKMQLGNTAQGIQNQYLPQNLQSQIAARNAQTGLTQQQTQNAQDFPVQQGVAGQMAYLDYIARTQGTNSPSYIFAKQMLQSQMAKANAMAAYYGANVQYKNLPTAVKNTMIGQGAPVGTLTSLGGGGAPQTQNVPQPQNNIPPNGITPQTIGTNYNTPLVQKAAQVSANQALTTNAQKNRLQAGVALETFLNAPSSQNALNTLANYSGLQGRLKAQSERFTNPTAYLQYQNANEQLPTIIAGGLKVLEGYPSTDQAVQRVTGYFNAAKGLVQTDPAAAAAYIRQGLQYIRDENAAVQTVNQPIFKMGDIYGGQTQAPQAPQAPQSGLPDGASKAIGGNTYIKSNGKWYKK